MNTHWPGFFSTGSSVETKGKHLQSVTPPLGLTVTSHLSEEGGSWQDKFLFYKRNTECVSLISRTGKTHLHEHTHHFCVHVCSAERQNHARELVREADLSQWDALVIMSGDGLLHEVKRDTRIWLYTYTWSSHIEIKSSECSVKGNIIS